MTIAIRWLLTTIELPLLERQFWSVITALLAIAAMVWLLLQLNGVGERYLLRHFRASGVAEIGSLLRLGRRVADVAVIAAGILIGLRIFRVDATAALAGLGIGGIAVALAAQKTLENVIGGLSIIFDKAVRVGDFLKLGETLGTVDYIGLRSTRIRTLDRTVLSVPNGQIAGMSVETLSSRDKFWFHHMVRLRYETTPAQMRAIIGGMRDHLIAHSAVDVESVRVRFLCLAASSLEIEVFAYIFARDWERFLEIQEDLLLSLMEIVEGAGTTVALPSQILHLVEADSPAPDARRALAGASEPART
jgi:MscS family membrane protein